MDTIWTIVNNQEIKVKDYFESLYLKCIIEGNSLANCQEFMLWEDLTSIKYHLKNYSTFNKVRIRSPKLLQSQDFCDYYKKETLTIEETDFISAHFLKDYHHLSKAIVIFDSYLKRITKEKKIRRSDNVIKIVIAVLAAISTLFAVWLGYSLKHNENGESKSDNFDFKSSLIIFINKSENDSLKNNSFPHDSVN